MDPPAHAGGTDFNPSTGLGDDDRDSRGRTRSRLGRGVRRPELPDPTDHRSEQPGELDPRGHLDQVKHYDQRPDQRHPLLVPSLRRRRRRPKRLERPRHQDRPVGPGVQTSLPAVRGHRCPSLGLRSEPVLLAHCALIALRLISFKLLRYQTRHSIPSPK
jgi:hypothetical protein